MFACSHFIFIYEIDLNHSLKWRGSNVIVKSLTNNISFFFNGKNKL